MSSTCKYQRLGPTFATGQALAVVERTEKSVATPYTAPVYRGLLPWQCWESVATLLSPSNAKATFIQGSMSQRSLKTT